MRYITVPRIGLFMPTEDVMPEFGGDAAPELINQKVTILKDGRMPKGYWRNPLEKNEIEE